MKLIQLVALDSATRKGITTLEIIYIQNHAIYSITLILTLLSLLMWYNIID